MPGVSQLALIDTELCLQMSANGVVSGQLLRHETSGAGGEAFGLVNLGEFEELLVGLIEEFLTLASNQGLLAVALRGDGHVFASRHRD